MEWQRNQNRTHFAELGGRRYAVARSPGIREWVLTIDGVFHSHWPTLDQAKQRAAAYASKPKVRA